MTDTTFNSLLAIDTSTRLLRLTLSFGEDRILKTGEEADQMHGQMIMKKIADLLASAQCRPADLDGIVVCTGPGSFTGLRIGIAAAKGMVQALAVPIVGVSVFEAAAYMLQEETEAVEIVTAVRRDEFIVGTVKHGKTDIAAVRVASITELASQLQDKPFAFVSANEQVLAGGTGGRNWSHRILFDASHILHIGKTKLEHGEASDLATLEPLYIQKSQAEIRFEKRQSEQTN